MPAMGDAKKAWDEVGERFAEAGRLLKEQYRKLEGEKGPEAAEERKRLSEAVKSATDQLDSAFTSLGNVLRDREARKPIEKAAESLGDAIATTFSEVGGEIQRAFSSRFGKGRNARS